MRARPIPQGETQGPTDAEIRARAYELYVESGRLPGRELENWMEAEAELLARKPAGPSPIPRKWRWHYRTLLRIRDLLLAERIEHGRAIREPFGRSEDRVDVAGEERDLDTLVAEISLEDAELSEVEAAMARIRRGTYGVCELTGEPIAAERLRAVPWTRLSLAAANRLDATSGHRPTPAAKSHRRNQLSVAPA